MLITNEIFQNPALYASDFFKIVMNIIINIVNILVSIHNHEKKKYPENDFTRILLCMFLFFKTIQNR